MPPTRRPTKAERKRVRAEAAKHAALQAQRRKRLLTYLGVGGAVAVIAVVIAIVATHRSSPATASPTSGTSPTPVAAVPTWPAPEAGAVAAAVKAAGLPLLSMEATDVHFHAHLDILDNGEPVTVPASIGLTAGSVSSMHTHDTRGVIHIESPTADTFTLGQFFTEWQQPLSATCVATLCTDSGHSLRFYVDGQLYTGDPTKLELKAHQEIAIVYGTMPPGASPPSSFAFQAGE